MYWTYIMRLWVSTIITAPFIVALLVLIFAEKIFRTYSASQIIWLFIIAGFILSIPTLLLFGLVARILQSKIKNSKQLRIATIITLIALIMANAILFLSIEGLERTEFNLGLSLSFAYCVLIIIYGLFFKLEIKHKQLDY